MNNFIIYSIEIAISLALFYTAYWVFLKNETFFKLNRFYLIFSVVISLLTPLINISVGEDSFVARNLILPIEHYEQSLGANIGNNYYLKRNGVVITRNRKFEKDNLVAVGDQSANTSNSTQILPVNSSKNTISGKKGNWLTLVLVVYFVGVALFFIRFLANFIWIFGYVLKHTPQDIFGMKVIRFEKSVSPFSFWNFIFISNKEYSESELDKIISHEKVHIKQKHTIDLILFELLLVFQWFNPFIWFYKRAVKINHEYLADLGTLKSGIDLPSYHYSLLNQVLRENNFEVASSYNFSVKKRIEMMKQKRSSKLSTLKLSITLPILVLLFSAFAFNTTNSKEDSTLKVENRALVNEDTTIKRVNVPVAYLKLLEGEYVSTNEEGRVRRIVFTELMGTLHGWDNMIEFDNGYAYKIIPVGDGKFINPDDHGSLEFDTKDKNAISLLLFGRINLNKVKSGKDELVKKSKALRLSLAYPLVNIMLNEGIPAALAYYKVVKDSMYLAEHEMNFAGYDLLSAGKTKEAAAIFKLTTELYPNSFNAYDSYADALLALGDKDLAIENIRKSLRLNPGSKFGLKKVKDLGLNADEFTKPVNVSLEELKLLEGMYLSTNLATWIRKIALTVEDGVLTGEDNGYRYKLIPMGNNKFINPDDGASLVFDVKSASTVNLLIFGKISLKKIIPTKAPVLSLKDYSGVYVPSKNDVKLLPMEILNSENKLFRFIENPKDYTANRNIELEFVTDNLFFYPDNSGRSIEFIVNDQKEVTSCVLRRQDGTFTLSKKK